MGVSYLKMILNQVTDSFKRNLRVGEYWYWLKASDIEDGLDIWPLIFPLRYDILVRKAFFDFYEENKDLAKTDFNEFMELARAHQYYDWYRKVLVVRYSPHLLNDENKLNLAYEGRVKQSIKLYDSIRANGFDINYPIIPYTGENVHQADTGRVVKSQYYMGDGCHRLACLMTLGYKTLPSEYVRVKCFRNLTPLDNTKILSSCLTIDPEWV